MNITPYIFYKKSEREVLREVVLNALRQWDSEWGTACQTFSVELFELSTLPQTNTEIRAQNLDSEHIQYRTDETRWCIFSVSAENKDRLVSMLLNQPLEALPKKTNGIVLDELFKHATHDLVERIAQKTETDSPSTVDTIVDVPASAYKNGSGCLMFEICLADIRFSLVVSGAVLLDHLADQRKSLTSPEELGALVGVCADHIVPIHLKIGTAEVKLADIVTLEVGDVLTLDQKLSDPVKLVISEKSAEHACLIGKVGAQKAVRILASQQ